MSRSIEIVPHDPRWLEAYALEANALRAVFGAALRSIHHVGSTSVPGLPAKPVIDILVVLDKTTEVDRFDDDMRALGYRVRGECLDAGGTPGRLYYSKPVVGPRTHHTHVCAEGHPQIPELLLFPDYLRANPGIADEYARLKRSALAEGGQDSAEYTARKEAWIRATVRDALIWLAAPDQESSREG